MGITWDSPIKSNIRGLATNTSNIMIALDASKTVYKFSDSAASWDSGKVIIGVNIGYGKENFIIFESGGISAAAISTDGVLWDQPYASYNYTPSTVFYEANGNKWQWVSQGICRCVNGVMVSRAITLGTNAKVFAYGAGKLVGIYYARSSSLGQKAYIYTSTDILTWDAGVDFGTNDTDFILYYINNKFIALGTYTGLASSTTKSTVTAVSTDGITWVKSNSRTTLASDLLWDGTYYITGSDTSKSRSTDGLAWVSYGSFTLPSASANYPYITFIFTGHNGSYLVGTGNNNASVTTDFNTFTACVGLSGFTITGSNLANVILGPDKTLLLNGSAGVIPYVSTDLLTWSQVNISNPTGAVVGYTTGSYGNGRYMLAGATTASNAYLSSTDGINFYGPAAGASIYSKEGFAYNTAGTLYLTVNGNSFSTSTDGLAWTASTFKTGFAVYYATFGNGIFVVGSGTSSVAASTDCITWTYSTSFTASTFGGNPIYYLLYGNGLFVISSYYGYPYYTSTDGITWSARARNPPTSVEHQLIFSGTTWKEVYYSSVNRSTDFVTWTTHTGISNRVAYGKTVRKVVAMTDNTLIMHYLFGSMNGTGVSYSNDDGITWSATPPSFSAPWGSSEDWVLVRDPFSNNVLMFQNNPAVPGTRGQWSPNGYSWNNISGGSPTWTPKVGTPTGILILSSPTLKFPYPYNSTVGATFPASTIWKMLEYLGNSWVLLNTLGNVYRSPNGIDWTAAGSSGTLTYDYNFKVNGRVYVSNGLKYTADGYNWYAVTGVGSAPFAVSYANGIYLMSYSAATGKRSTDGVTWTSTNLTTQYSNAYAIGNLFYRISPVSYGSSDYLERYVTSTDALTWKTVDYLYPVCKNTSGVYLVNSPSSVNFAYRSTDGITWSSVTLPATGQWQGPAYGRGKFIMVQYGGTSVISSTDGITWVSATLNVTANWNLVNAGTLGFTVRAETSVAASTYYRYSTDAITWVDPTPTWGLATAVAGGPNEMLIIHGDTTTAGNVVKRTTDFVTWTNYTLPVSAFWGCLVYGAGKYIAISKGTNTQVYAYSTDGITWVTGNLPNSRNWSDATYIVNSDVGFVLCGFNGNSSESYSSTDGINWTTYSVPSRSFPPYISGNKDFIVAVNANNTTGDRYGD
jgi:hypothetical protein